MNPKPKKVSFHDSLLSIENGFSFLNKKYMKIKMKTKDIIIIQIPFVKNFSVSKLIIFIKISPLKELCSSFVIENMGEIIVK